MKKHTHIFCIVFQILEVLLMIIYQLQLTVILFLMLFYTSLHHQQISFIIFHIFFHFFIAQFFVEFSTNSFNPSTLARSPPPLPPPHLINGQNLLSMTKFFNLVDLVMMLLSSAGRGDEGGGSPRGELVQSMQ